MIYLDNAATTEIAPEVLVGMMPFLTDQYGNAGSVHKAGVAAKEAVEHAREQVAAFFHCSPRDIVFTSGATEGNNMAIYNMITDMQKRKMNGGILITDGAEHDSVIHSVNEFLKTYNFMRINMPLVNGKVDTDFFNEAVSANGYSSFPKSASFMYVNNETGAVNDVKRLGEICLKNNMLFHTDCTQAAGMFDINVNEIGCSYATMSAHKIHGPKGVGAIYINQNSSHDCYIHGGADQEFGIRGGTENVPGIVGMGIACEKAMKQLHETSDYVSKLRSTFIEYLNKFMGEYGYGKKIVVHCNDKETESNFVRSKVASIYIPGIDGETLVLFASSVDLCISAGSACCSREVMPSHVLLAMGCSEAESSQTIRVSFSEYNSEDEVIMAAKIIAECVKNIGESLNE